jgi:NADH:ubiquinone reductase (H+-translocating)
MTSKTQARAKVVIIGAGFGGLYAAQALQGKAVDVLLIDRRNFHTFTPLLYQVATCGLEAEEIAYPIRGIFQRRSNVRFLLGSVLQIDPASKQVLVQTNGKTQTHAYDYLILAAGSVANFFGDARIPQHALVLKSLEDAITLRNHLLTLFEKAAWSENPAERDAMTTMVVVGGGPTGIETAGAMYELYNHVLRQEFPHQLSAKVILVEGSDALLRPYPQSLRDAALAQLRGMGVEVVLNQKIEDFGEHSITLNNGRVIPTHTLIWSVGVEASPLVDQLGGQLGPLKRVPVQPTLEAIGLQDVYAVGDLSYIEDEHGQPYPMMIPVATQQGTQAARNIWRRVQGQAQQPFRYFDRGLMATIGRTRAVAWLFKRVQVSGLIAWLGWLFLHLIVLMGFRNRLNVFINWVWNYLAFNLPGAYGARMILRQTTPVADAAAAATDAATSIAAEPVKQPMM